MVASAEISSTAVSPASSGSCLHSNGRLMKWISQISGVRIQIRKLRVGAAARTTMELNRTPSVFGRISVY